VAFQRVGRLESNKNLTNVNLSRVVVFSGAL
jgi:hypothetical protein